MTITMKVPYGLPLTDILPLTVSPQKKFIVSDPSKLDYFARAKMVRAGMGVNDTWGSLQGAPLAIQDSRTATRGPLRGLGDAMPAMQDASASGVTMPGSTNSVGDFFGNLGRSVFGGVLNTVQGGPAQPPAQPAPVDPTPYIVGGVAIVGLGGLLAYKLWKKR
jgi:hypothetical protein